MMQDGHDGKGHVREIGGTRVLILSADSDTLLLQDAAAGSQLIEDAWAHDAAVIVVPAARVAGDFFRLSTGIAGAITQKIVNFGLHLVIAGDLSGPLAESEALRAFMRESNRGKTLWFVDTLIVLEDRLSPAR